jgi:hypothetical protein
MELLRVRQGGWAWTVRAGPVRFGPGPVRCEPQQARRDGAHARGTCHELTGRDPVGVGVALVRRRLAGHAGKCGSARKAASWCPCQPPLGNSGRELPRPWRVSRVELFRPASSAVGSSSRPSSTRSAKVSLAWLSVSSTESL